LRDSRASANTLLGDDFETEERIRRSGLPHLLFRDARYLDAIPVDVGGAPVFETRIRLPAGDGRVADALRRDMGEALANAMLGHAGADRTYVAAPRTYSVGDVATALAEVSGKSVADAETSDEEYVADAARAGAPEHLARRVPGFYAGIRGNQLDETNSSRCSAASPPPSRRAARGLRAVGAERSFGLVTGQWQQAGEGRAVDRERPLAVARVRGVGPAGFRPAGLRPGPSRARRRALRP